MSERRRRTTGPRGRASAGPGSTGRTARATSRAPRPAPPTPTEAAPVVRPRSKLTGRAAVLVLVLAVLTVSYASSMRAYLQQRASIGQLDHQIAQSSADIDELTAEKKAWSDPAYVQQQARQRLGYVMPGDKAYLVLDPDGHPVDAEASLQDRVAVAPTTPTAWWTEAWGSMETAGHPPRTTQQAPASKINGAKINGAKIDGAKTDGTEKSADGG